MMSVDQGIYRAPFQAPIPPSIPPGHLLAPRRAIQVHKNSHRTGKSHILPTRQTPSKAPATAPDQRLPLHRGIRDTSLPTNSTLHPRNKVAPTPLSTRTLIRLKVAIPCNHNKGTSMALPPHSRKATVMIITRRPLSRRIISRKGTTTPLHSRQDRGIIEEMRVGAVIGYDGIQKT